MMSVFRTLEQRGHDPRRTVVTAVGQFTPASNCSTAKTKNHFKRLKCHTY